MRTSLECIRHRLGLALLVVVLPTGCAPPDGEGNAAAGGAAGGGASEAPTGVRAASGLDQTLARATALADSVEDLLRPVPLMRPAEEQALRRYSNAENLERARRLGARPASDAALDSLVSAGQLVRLEDSTRHWVIRELGVSRPYVTPDTRALLVELGEAFQARLGSMGLPAYRFEISSVLRTPADQAALRERNVNAASGTSAHEYGTTVDIAYSGYAAPEQLGLVPGDAAGGAGERAALEAVARAVLERMAARKSRELKAILGEVLGEAQSEGAVLVTLERLQPVYHITIAAPR